MYSLQPITTQSLLPHESQKQPPIEPKIAEGNPRPDTPKPAETPTLWFNPRSQRWISTSCRVYREILRDKALVQAGLPPGPSRGKTKKRKAKYMSPPQLENQPVVHTVYTPPPPQTFSSLPPASLPPPRPPVMSDREVRNAFFAKYGM